MSELVRAATLTGYADLVRRLGLDARRLVAAVGLPETCLADAEARIEVDAVRQLLEISAILTGAEDFGLRLAQTRSFSNLGPVGLALRDQPTVGHALATLTRYIRLHSEALSIHVDETGDLVILTVGVVNHRGAPNRQVVELSLGVLVRSLRLLLGPGWRPQQSLFAHAAPSDRTPHLHVFGEGLSFDQEFTGLVFAARDLRTRVVGADPVMARQISRYVDELAGAHPLGLRQQVSEIVGHLLPMGQCTIERLAQHLAVDRRTVHRRLAAEGATFSGIVQQVREDLARTYLAGGRRTMTQIAPLLGFSSLSAFSRWRRRSGIRTLPTLP